MKSLLRWVSARCDAGDVVGLAGVALAFNGAQLVLGDGWARLGLGLALIAAYLVRELRLLSGGHR